MFQSTLPRGERLISSVSVYGLFLFQSTPPRGERLAGSILRLPTLLFQSTPPSGERPDEQDCDYCTNKVSIHAPTWGATGLSKEVYIIFKVSIHAPTRRATWHYDLRFWSYLCFNPRSHAESDVLTSSQIRTPRSFNPRSHAESDKRIWLCRMVQPCFNPRSHAESDRYAHNKLSNMQLSM